MSTLHRLFPRALVGCVLLIGCKKDTTDNPQPPSAPIATHAATTEPGTTAARPDETAKPSMGETAGTASYGQTGAAAGTAETGRMGADQGAAATPSGANMGTAATPSGANMGTAGAPSAAQPMGADKGTAAAPAEGSALTDPQILAIVTTANTGEIDAGKLALSHSKNAEVKKLAQMMVDEHSKMLKDGEALAKKLGVTPADNSTSSTMKQDADQSARALSDKKGADFDKAYVDGQVAAHQQVLDMLDDQLIRDVQNKELGKALTGARAKVAAHLEAAKTLQAKMK